MTSTSDPRELCRHQGEDSRCGGALRQPSTRGATENVDRRIGAERWRRELYARHRHGDMQCDIRCPDSDPGWFVGDGHQNGDGTAGYCVHHQIMSDQDLLACWHSRIDVNVFPWCE